MQFAIFGSTEAGSGQSGVQARARFFADEPQHFQQSGFLEPLGRPLVSLFVRP